MKKITMFDKISCIVTIVITTWLYAMLINSVGDMTCLEPEVFGWDEILVVTLMLFAGFNVVHQLVVLYWWVKGE